MKVGDYIRTDDGLIGKIVSEPYEYKDSIGHDIDFGDNNIYNEYEMYQSIIKSSPNIIDLISYGDIVKYKIDDEIFISEVWGEKNDYFIQNFDFPIDLRDLDIISVLTKEQFEKMMYKVGDIDE